MSSRNRLCLSAGGVSKDQLNGKNTSEFTCLIILGGSYNRWVIPSTTLSYSKYLSGDVTC